MVLRGPRAGRSRGMNALTAAILTSPSVAALALVAYLFFSDWRDHRKRTKALAGFTPGDVQEIRDRLACVEAAARPSNVIPFPKDRR